MANDFTNETRLKAQWKLDNGALTVDSIGANTLTNNGTVTNDTTNYQEGDAAAYCNNNYLNITDANLDAAMPLKQGDTVKIGTWCYWFRCTSVPGSGQYAETVAKWNSTGSKITLENVLTNSKFRVGWGYTSGTSQETWDTFTVVVNRWYHVTLTFDGVNKTAHLRVWDATAGTATNYDKTWSNVLRICDCPMGIGGTIGGYAYPMQIDEVLVFNERLTDTEADRIRAGTFAPESQIQQVTAQVAFTELPNLIVGQVTPQVAWNLLPKAKTTALLENVEYTLEPELRVSQLIAQVEVVTAIVSAYVTQVMMQVEYHTLTNIEVEVDTIPIEIVPLAPSLQLIEHMDAVNIAIEALTMFPPGFGVSVATENILITPRNVSIAYGIDVSTIAVEIILLTVTVELIAKRKFPVPPSFRQQQSQLYRRKFPVGH